MFERATVRLSDRLAQDPNITREELTTLHAEDIELSREYESRLPSGLLQSAYRRVRPWLILANAISTAVLTSWAIFDFAEVLESFLVFDGTLAKRALPFHLDPAV